MSMAQNWIMIISEQHRYQGVSYKSDINVISGMRSEAVEVIARMKCLGILNLPFMRVLGCKGSNTLKFGEF